MRYIEFNPKMRTFIPVGIGPLSEAKAKFLNQITTLFSVHPETVIEPGEWHFKCIFIHIGPEHKPNTEEMHSVIFTQEELDQARADGAEKAKWEGVLCPQGSDKLISLDNGDVLYNHVGKYRSNLCFVGQAHEFKFKKDNYSNYNVEPDGDLESMRGDFFTSKKGTKCFRPSPNGKHILLSVNWGGAFSRTSGLCKFTTELYYRRASSNGGGSGISYWVVPFGWKRQLSLDEI